MLIQGSKGSQTEVPYNLLLVWEALELKLGKMGKFCLWRFEKHTKDNVIQ